MKNISNICSKYLQNFREININNNSTLYEGELVINNKTIILQIRILEYFPYSKPLFFLKDPQCLERIPHVTSKSGEICYIEGEGLFLNVDSPEAIMESALIKVIKVLEDGYNGVNLNDFEEEFEDYWVELCNRQKIYYADIENTNHLKELKIKYLDKNSKLAIIADNEKKVQRISARFLQISSIRMGYKSALLIPLNNKELIIPPFKIDNINDIRKLFLPYISDDIKQRIKNIKEKYLIFKFPKAKGGYILLGVFFSKVKQCNPLFDESFKGRIELFTIQRIDKNAILFRGGAIESLTSKKGIIIGCGSVGGYVANELIKSGIQNLTLIDNDSLKPENTYRHLLGNQYVTISKVLALKNYFEKAYLHSSISAIHDNIESVFKNKLLKWEQYDFVVIATGNPTIDLYINDFFYKEKIHTKLIFAWVEAKGIGGHTLFVDTSKQGCYKCAFQDLKYKYSFFEKNNASFSLKTAGCSSLFTPFSSIDSLQTAIQTVKTIINVMQKGIEQNMIYSWKGEEYKSEGYYLSRHYFNSTNDELAKGICNFTNNKCITCNSNDVS